MSWTYRLDYISLSHTHSTHHSTLHYFKRGGITGTNTHSAETSSKRSWSSDLLNRLWNINEGRGWRKEWSFWQVRCFWPVPSAGDMLWFYVSYTRDIKPDQPVSDLWKSASLETAGRPNISLPALATLKESICPKTKRGTSSFVRVSGSAVASSTLLMIGLVGRFSPSQAKDPNWLMGSFSQSLSGFGRSRSIRRESSRARQKESEIKTVARPSRSNHNSSSAECLSDSFGRVIGPWDLGAVQCWRRGQFLLQSLLFHHSPSGCK